MVRVAVATRRTGHTRLSEAACATCLAAPPPVLAAPRPFMTLSRACWRDHRSSSASLSEVRDRTVWVGVPPGGIDVQADFYPYPGDDSRMRRRGWRCAHWRHVSGGRLRAVACGP